MIQASKAADYDRYLHSYAELLYRWGALETRAEVLKRLSSPPPSFSPSGEKPSSSAAAAAKGGQLMIAVRCRVCKAESGRVDPGRGVCLACRAVAFRCVVCEMAVRGQSMFCLRCAHGGHTPHIVDWFQEHDVCPSGCGCRCVFAQSELGAGGGGGGASGVTEASIAAAAGATGAPARGYWEL